MDTKINPVVVRVSIGKKELREIEILPLSVADQFQLSDLISDCIGNLAKITPNAEDAVLVGMVFEIVRKNLGRIVGLIVREDGGNTVSILTRVMDFILRRKPENRLLQDITNDQAMEIARIVYSTNYEQFVKKVQSLLKMDPDKGGLLGRLSQIF